MDPYAAAMYDDWTLVMLHDDCASDLALEV